MQKILKWKNNHLLKGNSKTQEIGRKRTSWLLSGQPACAGGQGQDGGEASAPGRGAEREKQRKRQSKRSFSSGKQTPLPQTNKTTGNREKTKPGKKYFRSKWAGAAGVLVQAPCHGWAGFLFTMHWFKSAGGLLAAAGTCRMALIRGGGQLWGPLPWKTSGSSGGNIADLYRIQREQKRASCVFSCSCFKRDPVSLPRPKPG